MIYETALEIARRGNNEEALQELEAIAPYPEEGNRTPIEKVFRLRKWSRAFNGGWYGKPDFELFYNMPKFAPEYSEGDVRNLCTDWTHRVLAGDEERKKTTEVARVIKTPVIMIMGRHDLHTPVRSAKAYFDEIEAPYKKFITFEHSAHMPMWEQPGLFLKTLIDEVLPLADSKR